eukprot:scpid83550/ scgid1780/ 
MRTYVFCHSDSVHIKEATRMAMVRPPVKDEWPPRSFQHSGHDNQSVYTTSSSSSTGIEKTVSKQWLPIASTKPFPPSQRIHGAVLKNCATFSHSCDLKSAQYRNQVDDYGNALRHDWKEQNRAAVSHYCKSTNIRRIFIFGYFRPGCGSYLAEFCFARFSATVYTGGSSTGRNGFYAWEDEMDFSPGRLKFESAEDL